MKTKHLKIAYSARYPQSGFCTVPKIQMEGKWLEELGFSIGSTVMVEYEEGSIRIRPLTKEELLLKEEHDLCKEVDNKTIELQLLKKKYSQVAESSTLYGK